MRTPALLLLILMILSCEKKEHPVEKSGNVKTLKVHSTEKPSVTDTVFSNVITIEKKDISLRNDSLRITKKINDKMPILYIEERQPVDLLPHLLPEYPRVIVITPNWIGYEEIENSTPPGVCAEPSRSTVVYEFRHSDGKITKDSVIYFGENPHFYEKIQ